MRGLLIAAAMLIVAGCSAVAAWSPAPPSACESMFPATRCLAMLDAAAENLQVRPEVIADIAILPEPTPQVVNGKEIFPTLGGGTPIGVRVTLTDGSTRDTKMCGGVAMGPACIDDPYIPTGGDGPGSGFRDIPCMTPTTCPTPFPSLEPTAVAKAKHIAVARLDVPIDRTGDYEVKVGEGSLANGILTRTTFDLADDWPDHLTITGLSIFLDVRSLEPDGLPFDNYYTHGWRTGTERIAAYLVFKVSRFRPGAVLQVRDVVVE